MEIFGGCGLCGRGAPGLGMGPCMVEIDRIVIVFKDNIHATNAEQTYFAIRCGKVKRVDAASGVEAAAVCGGKSHFAAILRICLPRRAEASSDPRYNAELMRIMK
ncbi:hypothetical protein DPMN_021935 [Dreissena polymorpha]|uniref:Uncharacterized protein n=1 Tax=Dreissena polymorpha TaxID=45954 RepID=A0A9D4NLM9_DREPO|nr:hypothetical protein DPMN_021935 [Dreissena polymorpha]